MTTPTKIVAFDFRNYLGKPPLYDHHPEYIHMDRRP
jgi:hypothetical protein